MRAFYFIDNLHENFLSLFADIGVSGNQTEHS